MSVKYKIVLSISIIVLLIMSLVSYNYINYTQKNIKEISIKHLESIGHITLDRLDYYLEESQEKVKLFNSRLLLQSTLTQYLQNPNQESINTLEEILNISFTDNDQIIDIVILDTKGKVLASMSNNIKTDDTSMKSMFKRSLNGSYSHISFMNDINKPVLCLAEAVFKDNTFIGTTVFKIKLDELNDMLISKEILSQSAESVFGIYNKNKDIVLFTPLRFSKYPLVIPSSDLKKATPMRLALSEEKHNIITDKFDYRNEKVISSTHYFKPLGIGIVVKKDIKELMQPIEDLKITLINITLIGLIISVLISYIFSLFILKFINHIVETTSKISNANLNERIKISTNDEFGLISTSINKMADSLVSMNSTLEMRVQEKTHQLNHIFNITPNITIITNGKTIIKANNKFYEFTGYKDLESFMQDYNCICDMFSILKGFLRPKIDGKDWTEHIVSYPNETHRAIIEKDGIENLFLVNATTYLEDDNTNFIVIFENITEIQKLAYTDQLTRLANRLKIDEILERCSKSNERYNRSFTIILLDIDDFKLVNDTHGHLVGDEVLKSISKILRDQTRKVDLAGRWGGEEFIIISKETDINGALILAEKIRKAVESHCFEPVLQQTISVGVSQYKEVDTIDSLIKRADDALYRAKANGKNRVDFIN